MSAIRFLVADSSPALQTFLRKLLEGHGFEAGSIKTASTPQAALEVAADHPPHLLLSDHFPKESLSGLALHEAVLRHNPQCRLGYMAELLDANLQAKAESAGALFVLGKPFTAADIKTAVGRALEVLSSHHPHVASLLRSTARARLSVPALPRLRSGDAVIYQGRQDIVKTVILRQGELVVHLQGTPGMVPASKLSRV